MNFIDRYVDYATPLTEAPRMFHYFMAYALVSQVIGRKAICNYADYGSGPNFWFVFMATSGSGKSSGYKIGTDLLDEVYLNEPHHWRLPSGGSYESFIEKLNSRKSESGVSEGMMVYDEFKSLPDWLGRDYNVEMMSVLTTAYDQSRVSRRVGTRDKAVEYVIQHPFINIVAATTPTWFYKAITEKTIQSGFIARFCLIYSDEKSRYIPRRPVPDFMKRGAIIDELMALRLKEWGNITYEKEAGEAYDDWYVKMRKSVVDDASDNLRPFYRRRILDVHKFAMIHAVLRGSTTMNMADFTTARANAEGIMDTTKFIIEDKMTLTQYEDERSRILDIIKKFSNHNGGVAHSLALKKSKLDKKKFASIIETLAEEETIVINKESATGGRPGLFYKPTEEQ